MVKLGPILAKCVVETIGKEQKNAKITFSLIRKAYSGQIDLEAVYTIESDGKKEAYTESEGYVDRPSEVIGVFVRIRSDIFESLDALGAEVRVIENDEKYFKIVIEFRSRMKPRKKKAA